MAVFKMLIVFRFNVHSLVLSSNFRLLGNKVKFSGIVCRAKKKHLLPRMLSFEALCCWAKRTERVALKSQSRRNPQSLYLFLCFKQLSKLINISTQVTAGGEQQLFWEFESNKAARTHAHTRTPPPTPQSPLLLPSLTRVSLGCLSYPKDLT